MVECKARKPCCDGERGMWGLMFARMSLSSILTGVQRREIGLCEAASVGGFLGFRMGIILAVFQMWGIELFAME